MLGRSVNKILPSKKESWKLQELGFSPSVEAFWGKGDLAMTWYWDVEPEFFEKISKILNVWSIYLHLGSFGCKCR